MKFQLNNLIALAFLAAFSMQGVQAQEFISSNRSAASFGFDNFAASLDATGMMMSKMYDDRMSAFHHNYTSSSIGNYMNNYLPADQQYRQSNTSQYMANSGTNQSASNQGNNQGNNGFFGGGFPGGVGLPLGESSLFNPASGLNNGINRNFINSNPLNGAH